MQRSCSQCQASFDVTKDDLALLDKCSPMIGGKKYPIPPPSRCFRCRLQRRLAFYNCRTLYRRTCDLTKKPIVSIFSPSKPFKVYDRDKWYGDEWDPLSYGRPFDFQKPFAQQMRSLMESVPLLSLAVIGSNINSDYTNDNYKLKNCYLVFDGERGESCSYGHTFAGIRDCMDFFGIADCELCYETVHCQESYNLRYSRFCTNCSDAWFLRDCIGCRNCFGCANLRQKQFCVFNEQKTEAQYRTFFAGFESSKHSVIAAACKQTDAFFLQHPVKAVRGEQNIDSTVDNVHNSKNAWWCFDSLKLQDCRYCTDCMVGAKDCMDVHIWGDNQELCYESAVIGASTQRLMGCYYITQNSSDVLYSLYCSRGCTNIFGCIGLKHKQYCILNHQYTKEEYEELVPRIIAHMRDSEEWGEYFPQEISAFGYNETMAQTFFPLTKEEALQRGWQWCDDEVAVEAKKSVPAQQLPDAIAAIPDDVLNWAILCEKTVKPFKVTKQELEFYRTQALPFPRRHPNQRHIDRLLYKNPYQFWSRSCGKCGKIVLTTYSSQRPEIVYCEECYLALIY